MTDREKLIAILAAAGVEYVPPARGEAPHNLLLIGYGNGSFDLVLGADGKALQGVA